MVAPFARFGAATLLLVVLSLLRGSSASNDAHAGSRSRYFPETAYAVSGRFLDYWETSGRLAQFGYPVSPEIEEKSNDDGKTYTMQYFERAVFEYHPKNQPTDEVLLTRLGAIRYAELYGNIPAPNQMPNLSPGSVLFPQTGKRVGGPFLDYWVSHGGLRQSGYPITDEFIEVSSLDQKPYRVQYFERAVFELHSANQPPNQVLLSLLGRYRYEELHGKGPATPVGVHAANKLLSGTLQGEPAAGGHYIFWTDVRDSNMAIYGYDINTGTGTGTGTDQEFLVKTLPLGAASLATDGQTLVWIEGARQAGDSIHSYDIATGQETTVIPSGTAEYNQVAVDNGTLYYEKPGVGLVARTLSSGQEQVVSATGTYPVAADGKLLWVEQEQTCPPAGLCVSSWDLYLSQANNAYHNILLASSGASGFNDYRVSENKVVWADAWWLTDFSIYDITTATNEIFKTQGLSIPIISGNAVVWTEGPGRSQGWSIHGYDIVSKSSQTLVSAGDVALRAWAIVNGQGRNVVYSRGNELYLSAPFY